MKAEELRIGNLVTLDKKQRQELRDNQIHAQNDFFKVKTIYSDNDISIQVDDEIIDISEDDVNAILLNEEWLLKFGFKAKSHYANFILNNFEISSTVRVISTNERSCFYLSLTEDSVFNIKIDTVHQLQNLYFALTSEELSLKTEIEPYVYINP